MSAGVVGAMSDIAAVKQDGKKNRKHSQPFTAPKKKKTKDLIKQNGEKSPFLRLPRELRDKILRLAIGDRLIHIERKYMNFSHSICCASVTEDEAYALFHDLAYDAAAIIGGCMNDMRIVCNRHRACSSLSNLATNHLDLRSLRVCRQMYVEANEILWATNTWSFDGTNTLFYWQRNRNATQRKLFKKMHIQCPLPYLHISVATVQKYPELDQLSLDIGSHSAAVPDWVSMVKENNTALCFRAKKIQVIYAKHSENPLPDLLYSYEEGQINECIADSELIRAVLVEKQELFAAKALQGKLAKKALKDGFVKEPKVDSGQGQSPEGVTQNNNIAIDHNDEDVVVVSRATRDSPLGSGPKDGHAGRKRSLDGDGEMVEVLNEDQVGAVKKRKFADRSKYKEAADYIDLEDENA